MARPRVAIWALVALVAGAVALVPLHGGVKTADAAAIAFETPTIVDPIHTNGEPDIAIDPQGRVFNSGPTGTGTQRSTWFGSVDGGHTFRVMTQKIPASPAVGIPAPGPGGGDTDIAFDRSGKQYFADLWALACQRVAVTGPTNPGATDQENFLGCAGSSPGSDRQWLAVYDPSPTTPNQSAYRAAGGQTPLVYLVWNNLVGPGPNAGEQWNKSLDGVNYTNATADELPAGTGAVYSPFGGDGYPAIDQVTGKVFQAAACSSMTCGTSATATPGLYMNIGTPDAGGNLHFLDATGSGQDLTKLVKIADTPTGSPDTLFSVLSMDTGRNLEVVWTVGNSNPALRQTFVSASSAASGWRTWTAPVQVSDGSTATGDATNVFPWLKAGGPGRADAVWYGSDKLVQQPSPCSAQVADHCGAGVITIAHQSSGLGLFGTKVSGPSNSPAGGLSDPSGDALYPVIGGSNRSGMDIRSSSLSFSPSGSTLNVTMQVTDLAHPLDAIASVPGATNVQYVTRWQMGNTVYYAAMENTAANQPIFYAGAMQTIDLCSVSACFPHVLTYPEPGAGPTFTGRSETGSIACPAGSPCTLTISVKVADVGRP